MRRRDNDSKLVVKKGALWEKVACLSQRLTDSHAFVLTVYVCCEAFQAIIHTKIQYYNNDTYAIWKSYKWIKKAHDNKIDMATWK